MGWKEGGRVVDVRVGGLGQRLFAFAAIGDVDCLEFRLKSSWQCMPLVELQCEGASSSKLAYIYVLTSLVLCESCDM